jgi:hypothetical protein
LAAVAAAAPAAVLTGTAADASHTYPAHKHNAFSKYTILEQFGVTATEVFLGWEYMQDGNAVWAPANHDDSYCYHSGFPGWNTTLCEQQSYKMAPPGIEIVHGDIYGDFYSNFGPAYEMHSYGEATNEWNSGYKYGCDLTFGSLPPLWSNRCSGSD